MSKLSPIVTIEDGQLQGSIKVDWLGKDYHSFQGIPYAKPPLGNLRFKAPQPVNAWKGIKDATIEGSDCYNRNLLTQKIVGSEDCLYLNVYTSQLPSDGIKLRPVMVWIHGGGFANGSGSTELYGPDFLVSEDVVIVTINYRLGLLGFSSFCDPSLDVPGNAGLKDQVLALKWVQKNISKFGGDPKNVTIFGESAGSASVHFLTLSPSAKGLFHKAIAQSGVATSSWCKGERTSSVIAEFLECDSANELEVFKKFNALSCEKIMEIQEKIPDLQSFSLRRPFAIVVEPFKTESTFLSCEPEDILASGEYSHVPLMIGYTSREGMLFEFYQKIKYGKIQWISDFEHMIPYYFKLSKGSTESLAVAEAVKKFYYGDEEASMENIDRFYLIYTDLCFFIDIHNTIKEHTKHCSSSTYYYRMSLQTQLNIFKKLCSIKEAGVAHADDLGYLFKNALTPKIPKNSLEEIGIKTFLKLWTTFAKYGNPNPAKKDNLVNVTWPPVEKEKHYFLNIDENLTVGINPDAERVKFWENIFRQYCTK